MTPIASRKPAKVVIDTNVFISGLCFAGRPAEILELLDKGEIEVCVSPFILAELARILTEKFEWDEEMVARAIGFIKAKASVIQPQIRLSVIKGKEDDNRILECGLAGEVQYIISGDKRHILPLKQYSGIKILPPAEFLRIHIHQHK